MGTVFSEAKQIEMLSLEQVYRKGQERSTGAQLKRPKLSNSLQGRDFKGKFGERDT